MKNLSSALALWALILSLPNSLFVSAAEQKQMCGVTVVKVFEAADEVVLRVVVLSNRPMQYVIRSKDNTGEAAIFGTTSAAAKSKNHEGTSWVVLSRVKPNGENRTFEKVILQHGAAKPYALSTEVRTLSAEPKPLMINERKPASKLDVPLNKEIEVLRSEDLRILLVVGEELPEVIRVGKE